MDSKERGEKEKLVSFLKELYGENSEGYLTLWTLKDKKTRWFKAKDFVLIADEALHLATENDVYFGLGLRRKRLEKKQRGSVEHIIAIPGLWADIDIKGPAHKDPNLPPTEEDGLNLLADFPLSPTIVVNSGHGFQVWWLFKELWTFDTDEERQQAQALSRNFQATLQELARCQGWQIDSTPDLARVLRLPGTWNRKLEPVRVRINTMDKTRRYIPTDFDEYLLAERPRRSSQEVGKKIREGQRNTNLTSIAGTMRRRGLNAEEILPSLLTVNANRSDPRLPEDEVEGIAKSVFRYPAAQEGKDEECCHRTDLGNAKRLVSQHGEDIRYCYPWKRWLVWDSCRWIPDKTGQINRLAKETIRHIYHEAADATDEETRTKIAKWATSSEYGHRITAMISLARSEPGIPVLPEDLDSKPWLLNVINGTVKLSTGDLQPHCREDLCTKLAPVTYDPEAACPKWMGFLKRILREDEELIAFVQRAVGYALTGSTREQVLFMLYGTGSNGKSTFLETIRTVLGDYARHTEFETLLVRGQGNIRNDIARLSGARLVTAQEAEGGRRFAEAMLKNLTGNDTLTVRFLYSEFFEYKPEFKLFLATNHKPVIRGTDHAIWRRIHLLPFTVFIPPEERDKDLPEKLKNELPGILAWTVRGCLAWQSEGLAPPKSVITATQEYREEMDILAGFLVEYCVTSTNAEARAGRLYETYREWCEKNGEKPISRRGFSVRLQEKGFKRARTSHYRMWKGIGIRTSDDAMTQDDAVSGKSLRKRNQAESSGNLRHMCHSAESGSLQTPLATGIDTNDASMTQGGKTDDAMTRRSIIPEAEESDEDDAESLGIPS